MPAPGESLFVVLRDADRVRVSWDNRAVPKRVFLLLLLLGALLTFAVVALFLTLAVSPLLAGVVFVGITSLLAYSLLSRRWLESVELTRDAVSHWRKGFLAPGPRHYPLKAIQEIGFGYYRTGDDRESITTLSLTHTGVWAFNNRTIVGYWLRAGDQRLVFEALRAFARDAGLALEFVTYGVDVPAAAEQAAPGAAAPR